MHPFSCRSSLPECLFQSRLLHIRLQQELLPARQYFLAYAYSSVRFQFFQAQVLRGSSARYSRRVNMTGLFSSELQDRAFQDTQFLPRGCPYSICHRARQRLLSNPVQTPLLQAQSEPDRFLFLLHRDRLQRHLPDVHILQEFFR